VEVDYFGGELFLPDEQQLNELGGEFLELIGQFVGGYRDDLFTRAGLIGNCVSSGAGPALSRTCDIIPQIALQKCVP